MIGLLGGAELPGGPLEALEALAATVTQACQEWVKAVGHLSYVDGLGTREDTADFLTAVDRIGALEHATDDGERSVIVLALADARDFRQLHVLTSIADRLETTADALWRAALILRDQVLAEILA